MVFRLRSSAGRKLKKNKVEIKDGKDLVKLMNKYKCDLIVRNKDRDYEEFTIDLYDDYIE